MRIWLILALLAASLAAQHAQAYRLQLKDTEGTVRKYKLTLQGQGHLSGSGVPNGNLHFNGSVTLREKVVKSGKDGTATINLALRDAYFKASFGDKKFELPKRKILMLLSFDRTPNGATGNLKVEGGTPEITQYMPMLNAKLGEKSRNADNPLYQQMVFPTTDMSIGDGWGVKVTIDPLAVMRASMPTSPTATTAKPPEKMKAAGYQKLVGFKEINGKQYLLIIGTGSLTLPFDTSILEPAGQKAQGSGSINITFTGKSYTLFDLEAGEIFRTTFNGTFDTNISGNDRAGKARHVNAGMQMSLVMQKVN